ncbi:uncharacterized mitochondrial protein AtMg00810-like [Alnus glutinosa]|uniref:uncharacterized mitochondrial protein AtMg00810-like n=1 Tax=Alnus glutinosa TaxID=3517 RepID=UPI002D7A3920|nr:uncharacterized mitochondrial protein AtMg00810-like [Alnus glutinosa]
MSKFEGDLQPDPTKFRHIVGALQYVTLTRPDIAYSVNICTIPLQFTSQQQRESSDILKVPSTMVFITAKVLSLSMPTMMLIGQATLVTDAPPPAKKQNVVSRYSTEAEYRFMCLTTAKLYGFACFSKNSIFLSSLLQLYGVIIQAL